MAPAPETGYAPVNGLQMYYELHGSGGTPLVLLHGGLFDIDQQFGEVLPTLAATRRVIAADFQAHGRTNDIDRGLTTAGLASDVVGLLEHLQVARADVFGFSVGGAVALHLAIRHPELVRKVIVSSASFNRDGDRPENSEAVGSMTVDMIAGTPMEQAYAAKSPHPDRLQELLDKLGAFDEGVPGWSDADIQGIAAPTLITVGDCDAVKLEHAVRFLQLRGGDVNGDFVGVPSSQLAVFPGSTHFFGMARTALVLDVGADVPGCTDALAAVAPRRGFWNRPARPVRPTGLSHRIAVICAATAGIALAAAIAVGALAVPDLAGALSDATDSLGHWIYLAVAALVFLETTALLGFVIHGELALMLGGVAAERGDASLPALIALVCAAAVAGDVVSLLLGRRLGRPFLERHGGRVGLGAVRLARVDALLRHATAARPCSSGASRVSCAPRCPSWPAARASCRAACCPTASPAHSCGPPPSPCSATRSPNPSRGAGDTATRVGLVGILLATTAFTVRSRWTRRDDEQVAVRPGAEPGRPGVTPGGRDPATGGRRAG